MKLLKTLYFSLLIFLSLNGVANSQPFTKKYIMSFHTCDANCSGFQDHMVNLAESDDGINWSLVPNFVPYKGSVPDVIIRGDKLYIYTPGNVKRYDRRTNMWDSNPTMVGVLDSNKRMVNFVDPSAIVNDDGKIVLFFLNSTGSIGDPAGCQTYPCTKYFDSAIEEDGSDGTHFDLQNGSRVIINLQSSPQTASDPDIFYNGSNYVLYISRGGSTVALESESLIGEYSSFPNLQDDILTNSGGIPCGYYDNENENYWTFIHSNNSGNIVIKRAVHKNISERIQNFTTVIDGEMVGSSSTTTESPGICLNKFILSDTKDEIGTLPLEYSLSQNYPNPFNPSTTISYGLPYESQVKVEIFNTLGERVEIISNRIESAGLYSTIWNASNLASGIYIIRINAISISQNINFTKSIKMIFMK